MALRRCLGGCGTLINGGSYCARCKPRNGSTRKWRGLREQILFRDHHTCRVCGQPAEHIDHIIPAIVGGTDHPSNLQALCATCNLGKGAAR
jgi:5-methylcytosine-specific restriction enzyme A